MFSLFSSGNETERFSTGETANLHMSPGLFFHQSAGAVEYTDCTSTEG